jgi:CRISPR-associated protein Cas2
VLTGPVVVAQAAAAGGFLKKAMNAQTDHRSRHRDAFARNTHSSLSIIIAGRIRVGPEPCASALRVEGAPCLDFGQRVQLSVFECPVEPAQWAALKCRLIKEIAPKTDSLRFYYLGARWRRRVEHVGAKPNLDLEGPLVV